MEGMNSFNDGRAGTWSQQMDVDDRYRAAAENRGPRRQQPPPASQNKRQPRQDNRGPPPPKPVSTTAAKDDDMYTGKIGATVPTNLTASHNLEFSSYVNILKEFWKMMVKEDNRFERQVPFALFQHVMFGALHIRLAQYQKFENGDSLFSPFVDTKIAFGESFKIPKVLLDYLDSIATCVTPSGEKVAVNQPRIAIPQGPLPETDDLPVVPSGTFGVITAENHNVYECYALPYVSRRLIEHSIDANEGRNFGDWNLFPPGWLPEPCLVTKNHINLLSIGYF